MTATMTPNPLAADSVERCVSDNLTLEVARNCAAEAQRYAS